MKEILRTKNSKHFELENGKIRAEISQKPVHYFDNGEWKDISLNKTTSNFMGWTRDRYEENNFKTRLKDSDGSDLTEMAIPDEQGGEYWITIKNACEKEVKIEVSDIAINRVYEFISGDKIINPKSTILLDPRLKAEITGKGIIFKDNEKIIFRILPPKIESNFEYKDPVNEFDKKYNYDVSFKLTQFDRYVLLEKVISKNGLEWINERLKDGLKVLVDDTLTIQPDNVTGYDNVMRPPQPNNNYGTVQYDPTWLGLWGLVNNGHHLIKFDISSLPSGVNIISATQTLYPWYTSYAGFTQVFAYRLLRDWGETTSTHNRYDGSNLWTVAGATGAGTDVALTYSQTTGLTRNANPVSFSVLNPVKEIVAGATNYGWMLKTDEEAGGGNYITGYYMSEYLADPTKRPKLVIEYLRPSGFLMFFNN